MSINEPLAWALSFSIIAICLAVGVITENNSNVELAKIAQQHYHDSISVILSGKK